MSSAPHSYSMERKGNQLYSDRVFQPTDAARNKAQAEAVVCERCGKPVHPTNWMKHQQSDHSDDPKPLHDAHDRLPLAAIRTCATSPLRRALAASNRISTSKAPVASSLLAPIKLTRPA